MKTVILCGGLGARLREETEFRPKPMVHIGNRPILWHIMKIYAHYGHCRFVLALGYKGEMIKNYFCHYEVMNNDVTLELGRPEKMTIHRSHEEKGWEITLANTGEKDLKGSRLKQVEKYIDGDAFLLTYGDGVADVDLAKLVEFHHSHGKIATVTGVNAASQFGEMKIDDHRVTAFREKPDDLTSVVSGGFFVFNRRIFDYVTEDVHCDLEIGPLERLAREGQLMMYRHPGFWACMDTYRDVEYLNRLWERGEAKWKIW